MATKRRRPRRVRWLVGALAAIVGLAAICDWSRARSEEAAVRAKAGRKASGSVALSGVEYRPLHEVTPGFPEAHRAVVGAYDPVNGRKLWKVVVRQEDRLTRGMLRAGHSWMSQARFAQKFALTLALRNGGIEILTPDHGVYRLNPTTRQVSEIKPPVPPEPPILDARDPTPIQCEVHDRPLAEGVVPILYGYGLLVLPSGESGPRQAQFPHAASSYGAGCVVGEEREARVRYCPACREAKRAWEADPNPGKSAVSSPAA